MANLEGDWKPVLAQRVREGIPESAAFEGKLEQLRGSRQTE